MRETPKQVAEIRGNFYYSCGKRVANFSEILLGEKCRILLFASHSSASRTPLLTSSTRNECFSLLLRYRTSPLGKGMSQLAPGFWRNVCSGHEKMERINKATCEECSTCKKKLRTHFLCVIKKVIKKSCPHSD